MKRSYLWIRFTLTELVTMGQCNNRRIRSKMDKLVWQRLFETKAFSEPFLFQSHLGLLNFLFLSKTKKKSMHFPRFCDPISCLININLCSKASYNKSLFLCRKICDTHFINRTLKQSQLMTVLNGLIRILPFSSWYLLMTASLFLRIQQKSTKTCRVCTCAQDLVYF